MVGVGGYSMQRALATSAAGEKPEEQPAWLPQGVHALAPNAPVLYSEYLKYSNNINTY